MSVPATVSSAQTAALQGLHQRATQATHGTAAQPSQLQISFANLISSMQAGGPASSQTGAATQLGASAGAANSISGNSSTDLTSLIESLLASNGSASANNVLQAATEPSDAAKSQLGHHHHHHTAAQVSGASDSRSSTAATSAYTAMQSQSTSTNVVSAQA